MTFFEWMESTGGTACAINLIESDATKVERVLENRNPDAEDIGRQILKDYHRYLCAHIQHLLETHAS